MSDTNIVCIKGRLTKSAELKYTQNQKPFVSFSIAVNESIKDGATGEWSSRANYFDVTAWGKYGEAVAKYMTKGREILISGHLRQDRWTNQEGKTQTRVGIVADNFELLREPKGSNPASPNDTPQQTPPPDDAPSFGEFPPPEGNPDTIVF